MKKLMLLIAIVLSAVNVFAATILVSPKGKIHSIQKAIAIAHLNDTIIVSGGTYREKNIVIGKPLVLIGKNNPLLDGENLYEIISVKSSNVVVDGFRFLHSGYSDLAEMAAVKMYFAHHVVIRNNFFDNTFFGVYGLNTSHCFILNNRFQSHGVKELESGNGIHCWKCDSMTISGNTITGHRDGIYFEFVTNSIITNNHSIQNVRYGLHFMFSHNNQFAGNTFSGNGSGCAVMYSHNVMMTANTFSENRGSASFGILMKEISDSYVSGNHFNQNTSGIYMEGTTRIHVLQNDFSKNGTAMRIQASCNDNRMESNNFESNTFDVATNGSLVLNTFDGNYWDKYDGYDLDRDGTGDVPFHPVSMFSMLSEQVPEAMMLFHSFIVTLLDHAEKIIPTITPENFRDDHPLMKPVTI